MARMRALRGRAGRAIAVSAAVAAALTAGPAAAPGATPSTLRASLSSTGAELGLGTYSSVQARASVSTDGRWVTFESSDPNVVPGDTNGTFDVFQRDLRTGVVRRVSQTATGVQANGNAWQHAASADGAVVAFQTSATTIGAGTTNSADDVYVWRRGDGSLRRVSTNLTGNDPNSWSRDPRPSPDGTAISFAAVASDLVAGDTGAVDIFVADTATLTVRRVSARAGTQLAPNGDSDGADVSDGGRFVSFASTASDLVATDTGGFQDVFVRDMVSGAVELASVSAGGQGNGASSKSAITPDGCAVAFNSAATNLVAASIAGGDKTMVRTRCGTPDTVIASLTSTGVMINVPGSLAPDISADGCAVLFETNLIDPGGIKVYLRDRCEGVTSRIDLSSTGEGSNGSAVQAFLSGGTARYVAFTSNANNLVAGDGNGDTDVFVRDRANATGPVAALAVAVDGRRVVADATGSSDADNGIASATIAFGDGTPPVDGLNATHDYARDGDYTVTATVTDRDGLTASILRSVTVGVPAGPGGGAGGGGGGSGPPIDPNLRPLKLELSGGVLSRARFKVVPRGGRVSSARGATLRLAISEAARLTVSFDRSVRGRRAGGRCSPTTRRGVRCTSYKAAGTTSLALPAGTTRVPLTGRLETKALTPGRYRLRAVARAADGRRSATLTRTITIARG